MNNPGSRNVCDLVIEQLIRFMPKNMTQYELAQKSGLPFSTIKSIFQKRTKNITLKTIIMLSSGLGIKPWDFINNDKFLAENLDLE